MDIATEIMVFVEGPGGPGMLSLRADGGWGIDANTGASLVFTLSRPTRDALAVAYFWHAHDELTAAPDLARRLGESAAAIDRAATNRKERARRFTEFAARLNLKR